MPRFLNRFSVFRLQNAKVKWKCCVNKNLYFGNSDFGFKISDSDGLRTDDLGML
jgi:hypothetical protein